MKAILKVNDKEIEVEVSEEQLAKLTEKKNPFKRNLNSGKIYCFIGNDGEVYDNRDAFTPLNHLHYKNANYCTDKALLQQQAWRETLNRLLWRWQYENDKPVDWGNECSFKYKIVYNFREEKFITGEYNNIYKTECAVYFSTKEKAKQAIEEVVKPFMKKHPDFVW